LDRCGLLPACSQVAPRLLPGCSGLLQVAPGRSGLLQVAPGFSRLLWLTPGQLRGCSRLLPACSGLLQGRSVLLLGYSGLLCGALDRSTLFQLLSATPCYSRSPRVAPGFLQLSSRLLQANSRLLCFAPLVPGLLQVTPCCSSLPRGIPRCSRSHWVVPRLLHFALGLLHVTPRCWGAAPGRSRLLHVAPGCCTLLCATSI